MGYLRQAEVGLEDSSDFEWHTYFKLHTHGADSEPEKNPHRRGEGCKPPNSCGEKEVQISQRQLKERVKTAEVNTELCPPQYRVVRSEVGRRQHLRE